MSAEIGLLLVGGGLCCAPENAAGREKTIIGERARRKICSRALRSSARARNNKAICKRRQRRGCAIATASESGRANSEAGFELAKSRAQTSPLTGRLRAKMIILLAPAAAADADDDAEHTN